MHNRKDHRLSYADLSNQGQFNEKRLKEMSYVATNSTVNDSQFKKLRRSTKHC